MFKTNILRHCSYFAFLSARRRSQYHLLSNLFTYFSFPIHSTELFLQCVINVSFALQSSLHFIPFNVEFITTAESTPVDVRSMIVCCSSLRMLANAVVQSMTRKQHILKISINLFSIIDYNYYKRFADTTSL